MNSIFVEGIADQKFLKDIIKRFIPEIESFVEIIEIKGYTNIKNYRNKFLETNDAGFKNLVIFDADDNKSDKITLYNNFMAELKFPFDYYFFPDNQLNGDLEDVLLDSLVDDHKSIIDCFERYEACLSSNSSYTLPNKKAKIYAYCEAIYSKNENKFIYEKNRNYNDSRVWNIDNEKVNKIVQFIRDNIHS